METRFKAAVIPLIALAATAFAGTRADAAEPAAQDQVVASFERMLAHEPSRVAPAVPAGTADDPLRVSVSSVLWTGQPASFHVAARDEPRSRSAR